MLPLNHLKNTEQNFDAGFKRNDKQSQIDWCIVNQYRLSNIANFRIVKDCPVVADHNQLQ